MRKKGAALIGLLEMSFRLLGDSAAGFGGSRGLPGVGAFDLQARITGG